MINVRIPGPLDPVDRIPSARLPMQYLPPEEVDAEMAELAKETGGFVETLGKILDTPGALARGVMAGKPLSGFSFDDDVRVSGEELLEQYGLKYKNPYARTIAGLTTEILVDPLAFLSFPKSALTQAGRAAKAAGILDLAPAAAAARMGYDDAAKTLTGRFTDDALKKMVPELPSRPGQPAAAATEGVLDARPLLGPRYARANTTLDEVVQMADDKNDAMEKVLQYLKANSLSWDDVKDEKLGGLLGFGLPFGPAQAVWNPEIGKPVLDAMDALGQRIAWSTPARYASAWFDKRMDGATSAAEQVDMLRLAARQEKEVGLGRRLASRYLTQFDEASPALQQAIGGADGIAGAEANSALLRMFESVPNASDQALLRQFPELQRGVDDWDNIRIGMLDEAKQLGLQRNRYGDKFGVTWSPAYAAEIAFQDASKTGRAALGGMSSDAIGRVKYLQVPGGRDELREISLLPMVREHARLGAQSPYSNAEVGEEIRTFLRNRYGSDQINRMNASKQAAFFQHIKEGVPDNYPVFAEHPLNAQARAIINHRGNVARAGLAYDLLTENALRTYASDVQGGNWKSLATAVDEAARELGLQLNQKKGAGKAVRRQIEDRIRSRFGLTGKVNLNEWSLPQSVFDRVVRVKKIYESPKAWQDVWNLFEKFTTVFKGFVLAWPSRHVRDAYSNAFSVWLETGNAADTLSGMYNASQILAGNYDAAMPFLRALPRYSDIANTLGDDAVRQAFKEDAGGSGVLSTLASSDLLSARQRAAVSELVPGSTPTTISGGLRELMPDGSRSPTEAVRDFFTIQGVTSDFQTRNPLLNASQKINDTNDSIARLGGMLALMKQGISPNEAAKRITAALVDYGSLTDVEKQVFKNVFPWWTYTSRAGKYVVQSLLERPGGRYGQTLRALSTLQRSDDDTYIPSGLRDRFAVRVPDALLPYIGRPPRGEGGDIDTYVTNVDIPGLGSLQLPAMGPGGVDIQGTIGNLLQESHPLIRTVGELATNTDLFSKRPLNEAEAPLDRIYQRLFGTEARLNPTTKAIIQNIPGLQRPISLFGGLADDRLSLPQRLYKQGINQTLGFSIQDVDELYRMSDMLGVLQQRMSPYAVEGSYTFIPDELRPELTPQQLRDEALMKEGVRRKNEASKKRKAARQQLQQQAQQ